ncbi:5-formyltetrahydrofolate cyclo-ligase [Rhizohabitans arisaemae]|uniref:5-formyltetrahydrofolate cyclo-ligase n=1 Tax=Rhizohabitans arisaemae TaxID=2720610 RepID=UPI0024B0AB04|nr:5-formyltetrahydrofolate cyclo-ligase [Rhizohabitans arisaemae]
MDDVEKAAIRRRVLATRAERGEEERRTGSASVRETLLEQPWVQMAGTVACYWSIGAEPPSHGLVFALWKHGKAVILPVLQPDGDLDWAAYDGPDTLAPGPRGLMEPVDTRRGPDAVRTAALVIVPALAVDPGTGVRLGRGGGSYDRALARVGPNVPTVALVYDDELVPGVPWDPHDQRVKWAATPSALTRVG